MKFSDVILKTATKVLLFIIMTFSIYILFSGHNNPGGGFIAGLITASAILLLYVAFDVETAQEIIAIDFKIVGATGLGMALFTGIGAVIFNAPFLTQVYEYIDIPIMGNIGIGSSLVFDLGVYLAVIGTTVTIIQSISEDT